MTASTSRGRRCCPEQCAMRSRPAGAAAVLGRPTTRRTIAVFQRLAAPPTGSGAGDVRPRLGTLTGRSEQLLRWPAGRPAVTDHPTGQVQTRTKRDGRRDRWDGLGEQQTHFCDVSVAHPPKQIGGRGPCGRLSSRCPLPTSATSAGAARQSRRARPWPPTALIESAQSPCRGYETNASSGPQARGASRQDARES